MYECLSKTIELLIIYMVGGVLCITYLACIHSQPYHLDLLMVLYYTVKCL